MAVRLSIERGQRESDWAFQDKVKMHREQEPMGGQNEQTKVPEDRR